MLKQISSSRSFNGFQKVFEHGSEKLHCYMRFGVYLPDDASQEEAASKNKYPVLFWLSGITCTEENFIVKSGMQRFASAHKIVVVNPDTTPRGRPFPEDGDDAVPENAPEFGQFGSAGFYLDATQPKFVRHFRMHSYIVDEFVPLIFSKFSVDQSRCSIFGHSMGGHGALLIGLKNPGLFKSISVFAPISNPINSTLFGQPYFTALLGPYEQNREKWAEYDSVEVAKKYIGPKRTILIEQGLADAYLEDDLLVDNLVSVSNPSLQWDYRRRDGYDHGYYFIQTFIEGHFQFHKQAWATAAEQQL